MPSAHILINTLINILKNKFQPLLLVLIINLSCFAIAIQPAWSASFAVRVFDGDNITLVDRGIKTKVHLACIDAPELLQSEGEQARKILQNILEDEEVYVKVFKKDKFGRYTGEVLAGGQNANKVMLSLGLAHYDLIQEKDCQGYADIEKKAQSDRLGIWANGLDVMTPAQFRRDNKLLGVGY